MEYSIPDVVVPSGEPSSEIAIPDPFDEFVRNKGDDCVDVPRPKRRRRRLVGVLSLVKLSTCSSNSGFIALRMSHKNI